MDCTFIDTLHVNIDDYFFLYKFNDVTVDELKKKKERKKRHGEFKMSDI